MKKLVIALCLMMVLAVMVEEAEAKWCFRVCYRGICYRRCRGKRNEVRQYRDRGYDVRAIPEETFFTRQDEDEDDDEE
uniref:Tachyplesin-1 n=3 Tax=Limulidae TaxID=6846 RepID=TAC1_TACTR|nr:RecName: Full=Tachyplesin-1; AltName: Full=Tachyplesin I; Flags: Precursor [Tachypleus tridentatus]AAA63538.1 tachyplesin [Tachypleus tridentatus]